MSGLEIARRDCVEDLGTSWRRPPVSVTWNAIDAHLMERDFSVAKLRGTRHSCQEPLFNGAYRVP